MPAVAANPFVFYSRLHLRELTGLRAFTIGELLDGIRAVHGSCIYHHTHHFLQRHQHLLPEPPNDFAHWVAEAMGEARIAESLSAIDTVHYSSIRALREKLASSLEAERAKDPRAFDRPAPEGEAFDFIKSVSVVFATPHSASTLGEFADALGRVTISSLYFHVYEARLRLGRPTNDFSHWLADSLGEVDLARRIARIDPYTHTMEGLRERIIRMVRGKAAHY